MRGWWPAQGHLDPGALPWLRASGLRFRVYGFRAWVLRVLRSGLRVVGVLNIGLGVEGHICKIWGSVFGVQDLGLGLKVSDCGLKV